jgi:RimJ/RimL family protein N-acetyltransferase
MQSKPGEYAFGIRTLTENKPIGFCGLECVTLPHGEGVLGIGIGDRNYWGKGYGTDAIRVLLRFGFMDCNLHRVGLNVFEYNNRALASYRKIGFQEEGRVRSYIQRDGKRWDLIYMAMLRSEWDHNQVV